MSDADKVTSAICALFETGPVDAFDISERSISSITIRYQGKKLEVSWYPSFLLSGRHLRSIRLDGQSLPVSNHYAQRIFSAALARTNNLTAETLNKLAQGGSVE